MYMTNVYWIIVSSILLVLIWSYDIYKGVRKICKSIKQKYSHVSEFDDTFVTDVSNAVRPSAPTEPWANPYYASAT